jgi:hypothetical protein
LYLTQEKIISLYFSKKISTADLIDIPEKTT